ncbi:DUF2971 domain-containing protein [Halomonas sp. H5]|uniref:DUF2971 domain-containing protein n=1 Tax=Halomonas sp. H5 TaxID=3423910 RepID=UPI003D36EE75
MIHGPETRFYKYFSTDGSIATLDNMTLKWTSPNAFNDPFEFPDAMDFKFDGRQLASALLDEIVEMAYGPDEPQGNPNHPFIAVARLTRNNPRKPTADDFRAYMAQESKRTARRFEQGLNKRRKFLRNFRSNFSVLCLTENKQNLLMWAHYSQDHKGCVFQLRCLPELDRPLCAARKVNYVREYPIISGLDTYVKHLIGQNELDYNNLFNIFAFTKSSHWSYESEWRCVSQLRNFETGVDFDPLVPDELEAIYLGCRSEPDYIENVIELVRRNAPNTKVYKAHADIQDYSMRFKELR